MFPKSWFIPRVKIRMVIMVRMRMAMAISDTSVEGDDIFNREKRSNDLYQYTSVMMSRTRRGLKKSIDINYSTYQLSHRNNKWRFSTIIFSSSFNISDAWLLVMRSRVRFPLWPPAPYWLGRCQYNVTGWDRSHGLPALSRVWQHVKLSDALSWDPSAI